ncbi:MAG: hypothetical protein ACOZAP_04710 [Pseudomonadota bacterium]
MAAYHEVVSEHQRLVILQALTEDADYSHNEAVLHSMLAAIGHGLSLDALRAQLRWLEDVGLVTVEEVKLVGLVARVTARGVDAARGLARVDGVARPRPGMSHGVGHV